MRIERSLNRLVETFELDLHGYLTAALSTSQDPTNNHHGRLSRSFHGAVTVIAEVPTALVDSIEGLCGLSVYGD